MLDRHGVKATFFSIGHYAREQSALLREVAAAGHAIGNHTYNHITMALHSDAKVREEVRRTTEAIEDAGVEMATALGRRLMRPPYGRRRPGTMRVLREEGYIPICWSVMFWDWNKGVTTEKIMRRAEKEIKGGDVLLLHDGNCIAMGWDRSHSVHATDLILQQWKEQEGFEFVTIPEMIERQGFALPRCGSSSGTATCSPERARTSTRASSRASGAARGTR